MVKRQPLQGLLLLTQVVAVAADTTGMLVALAAQAVVALGVLRGQMMELLGQQI
jgi:hypothetical protein